jgi:hypothetical protein
MSSTVFRVTGTLQTPVLIRPTDLLHGDALLHAAAVQDRFPDTWLERPPDVWEDIPLPLDRQAGVYQASCLHLMDGVWGTTTLVKHTDTQVLAGRTQAAGNKKGTLAVADKDAYMYRAALDPLTTYHVPAFHVFYAVPDEHEAAFRHLVTTRFPHLALGAHRHLGYGQIGTVTLAPVDFSSAVLDAQGAPLRPLPDTQFADAPPTSILRFVRLAPPYWHGPKRRAYCPVSSTLYGKEAHHGHTA